MKSGNKNILIYFSVFLKYRRKSQSVSFNSSLQNESRLEKPRRYETSRCLMGSISQVEAISYICFGEST